jgi:leucyl/phenylalanyl-tRNA--protein transferase
MPVYRLSHELVFPPVHLAETGLLAVGGDLSVDRLLLAYRTGIFPWYSEGEPIMWWSPDPRMVLYPHEFHCSRSLRRVARQGKFRLTLNQAFPQVIRACATVPRGNQDGTWITPEMEAAYIALHEAGYAKSIECWAGDRLVGGLYGVAIGGCYFGESMFSTAPNASKIAMLALSRAARAWGIPLIDCQVANPHLKSLGAREIGRREFCRALEQGLQTQLRPGAWSVLPPLGEEPTG